jgi:UDP-N-acetylmuramate dehydrogenase
MKTFQNISLVSFNSFGIESTAKTFIELSDVSELNDLIKSDFLKNNYYILGGGSNILFTENFDGTIIHPVFKGVEIIEKNSDSVKIKVKAGEVWDDFVSFCVDHDFGGIENLSLIPGHCGAAPVQNIGAFGVEIKDTLTEVEIMNLESGKILTLSNAECNFGYRSSVFKNSMKHSWMILSSTYKLTTKNHNFSTHYGNISEELKNFQKVNLSSIRQSVIDLRTKKLPDPKIIGNAGSFFKNPIVNSSKAEEIKKQFPDAPVYPVSETETKLAAGWLIEKCGWKGKRTGNVGVHDKQSLVLINYGHAKGSEIINLSEKIKSSVLEMFNIKLETEVNFL